MEKLYDLVKEGQVVVFYNWWAGYESIEMAHCFTSLKSENIWELNIGDYIWADEEPYSLQGRIWGRRLKGKITRIENGVIYTDISTYREDYFRLCFVKRANEKKLVELINKFERHVFNLQMLPDNLTKEDIGNMPSMDEVYKAWGKNTC